LEKKHYFIQTTNI